jgi:DNA helicase-2/ATP-dependent DNA helicase PcrA
MLYGSTQYNQPSRFLHESGVEEEVRTEASVARPAFTARPAMQTPPQHNRGFTSAPKAKAAVVQYSVGERVKSSAFGEGMIVSAKPMGNDTLLEVAFEDVGTKKLMANFAKLEKI